MAEIPHDITKSPDLGLTPSPIIPQCDSIDQRLYAPMQCRRGSADCYCVTPYGHRLTDRSDLKSIDLNCTHVREVMSKQTPKIKSVTSLNALISQPNFNFTNTENSFEQHDDDILQINQKGMIKMRHGKKLK